MNFKGENFKRVDELDGRSIQAYAIENYLFKDKNTALEYLNSCDCELETVNFYYDRKDFETYGDFYKDGGYDSYGEEGSLEVEDAIDNDIFKYQEYVDDLCDKYNIEYDFDKYSSSGSVYTLRGKFGDLLAFSKVYDAHMDLQTPGEALQDFKDEVEIDINSGDEDLILAEI